MKYNVAILKQLDEIATAELEDNHISLMPDISECFSTDDSEVVSKQTVVDYVHSWCNDKVNACMENLYDGGSEILMQLERNPRFETEMKYVANKYADDGFSYSQMINKAKINVLYAILRAVYL